MQSRERGYMIPPSQVQFSVTHRETRNEVADASQVSTDEVGP